MSATYRRIPLLAIWALACAGVAHAQAEVERGLRFYVDAQSSYDDNLFRLPHRLSSQQVSQLASATRDERIDSGSIGMAGNWSSGLQAVILDLQAQYNRFAHNSSLDNTAADGKLEWDWRVTDRWSGKVGANFDRALASFANNYFLGKDSLDTLGYFGEFDWRLGTHWVATATAKRTTTSHSAAIRKIDDYTSNSGAFDIDYTDSLGDVFGGEYRYTNGRYPHVSEINGLPFDRSYHDNTTGFHVTYLLTGRTTFRGSTGYLKRTYPNAGIGNFSGSIWRASLEWQGGGKSDLLISGWRELTAYVDSQSDYFVSQGLSIAPTWKPTEKLTFSLSYSRERESYIGSNPGPLTTAGRRDTVTSGQLTATWTPRQFLTTALSYRLARRQSNISALGFDDHIVSIDVRFSL
jgi:exopolysaccharide biosynthesis operon protein EpsL